MFSLFSFTVCVSVCTFIHCICEHMSLLAAAAPLHSNDVDVKEKAQTRSI